MLPPRFELLSELLPPVLFVLNLPPVLGRRLVAVRLAAAAGKGRPAGVQLVALAVLGVGHGLVGDGHVAAEALAHVDHAALALAKALLELLALCRQLVDEGRAEAVGGRVALEHDAVGFLEALGEGLAEFFARAGHGCGFRGSATRETRVGTDWTTERWTDFWMQCDATRTSATRTSATSELGFRHLILSSRALGGCTRLSGLNGTSSRGLEQCFQWILEQVFLGVHGLCSVYQCVAAHGPAEDVPQSRDASWCCYTMEAR